MYTDEQLRKLKHDLKRPFSNMEMLITILRGSDMDKQRLIVSLEKILAEGKEVICQLDKREDEK